MDAKLKKITEEKQTELQNEIQKLVKKFSLENDLELDELRFVEPTGARGGENCRWVKRRYRRNGRTFYKLVWVCR